MSNDQKKKEFMVQYGSKDHLTHLMNDKNKTVASIAMKKLKDMK